MPGEINRGMTHESTMAAINRFSPSDPKEMSLSELMTCMMMMVYQSESERREALQTAKGSQLLIQMDQARMAWGQSREAAEKEFSNALMTSIGTICSGVVSAGIGIAGAAVQGATSYYNNKIQANNQTIQKAQLAGKVGDLQKNAENIAENNAQEIAKNEQTIKDKEAKLGDENASKEDKDKLENEIERLSEEIKALTAENEKLGFGINFDEKGALIKNSSGEINYDETRLKDDPIFKQIKELGGEMHGDGTITDKGSSVPWGKDDKGNSIEIKNLQDENTGLESKVKSLSSWTNGLQSASAIGQVFAGGFQIGAAYAQKDAAFLRAEAQLTDAFRNFSGQLVSNIDQSAEQALRQMGTLISSLKEVFRAAYDIECSIARNI